MKMLVKACRWLLKFLIIVVVGKCLGGNEREKANKTTAKELKNNCC